MQDLIIEIMNNFGYIGVFLLITIENVFPPIPSEVILLFGGFMTTYTSMNVIGVIIASTLGSVLGAIILYYIGKILNKERLKKIITSKPGKLLRLKPEDIDKADEWFDTKGNKTVFFCRFIPVVRSLISIPAGMSEMKLVKFIAYTTVGSAIWNTVLVCVGAFAGDKKDYILSFLDEVSHIVLILIIIVFCIFVYRFYKTRLKSSEQNSENNK